MEIKRIIPCLDIKDGQVVKGVNFTNLREAGNPVELAVLYSEMGADELVFLDISATRGEDKPILDIIKETAKRTSIPLIVGGGISSLKDIKQALQAGASKVSIGSASVKEPDLIKKASLEFGSQSLVVAIDARWNGDIYEVYINGGKTASNLEVISWAKELESLGAGEILLTSMDKDGTKDGYDNKLNSLVTSAVAIPIIASGGAGNLEHLYEAVARGGVDALLCASIFHFQEYTISEAKNYLKEKGVLVRL